MPAARRVYRGGGLGTWAQREHVASVGEGGRAQRKAYCNTGYGAERGNRKWRERCADSRPRGRPSSSSASGSNSAPHSWRFPLCSASTAAFTVGLAILAIVIDSTLFVSSDLGHRVSILSLIAASRLGARRCESSLRQMREHRDTAPREPRTTLRFA
jgi:hypothetical protein